MAQATAAVMPVALAVTLNSLKVVTGTVKAWAQVTTWEPAAANGNFVSCIQPAYANQHKALIHSLYAESTAGVAAPGRAVALKQEMEMAKLKEKLTISLWTLLAIAAVGSIIGGLLL